MRKSGLSLLFGLFVALAAFAAPNAATACPGARDKAHKEGGADAWGHGHQGWGYKREGWGRKARGGERGEHGWFRGRRSRRSRWGRRDRAGRCRCDRRSWRRGRWARRSRCNRRGWRRGRWARRSRCNRRGWRRGRWARRGRCNRRGWRRGRQHRWLRKAIKKKARRVAKFKLHFYKSLTAEQKLAMRRLRLEKKRTLWPLKAQVKLAKAFVKSELLAENPNDKTLNAHLDNWANAVAAKKSAKLAFFLKARSLLTTEKQKRQQVKMLFVKMKLRKAAKKMAKRQLKMAKHLRKMRKHKRGWLKKRGWGRHRAWGHGRGWGRKGACSAKHQGCGHCGTSKCTCKKAEKPGCGHCGTPQCTCKKAEKPGCDASCTCTQGKNCGHCGTPKCTCKKAKKGKKCKYRKFFKSLTDEQKKLWRDLKYETKRHSLVYKAKVRLAKAELLAELMDLSTTQAKLDQKVKAWVNAKLALKQIKISAHLQFYRKLDANQKLTASFMTLGKWKKHKKVHRLARWNLKRFGKLVKKQMRKIAKHHAKKACKAGCACPACASKKADCPFSKDGGKHCPFKADGCKDCPYKGKQGCQHGKSATPAAVPPSK